MRPAKRLDRPHPAAAFPRILRTTVVEWAAALHAEGAVHHAAALRLIAIWPPSAQGAGDRGRWAMVPIKPTGPPHSFLDLVEGVRDKSSVPVVPPAPGVAAEQRTATPAGRSEVG